MYAPPDDVGSESLPIVHSMAIGEGINSKYLYVAGSDKMIRIFDIEKRGMLPVCKVPIGELYGFRNDLFLIKKNLR